jgi:DNA-binding response OmpR family regulator
MEKNPKVLILEDSESIALTMREMLTLLGFDVVCIASTVSDALNQAEITRPEIAIFDVRLAASQGGLKGASHLRGMLGMAVVFVAAEEVAEKQARAEAAGRAALLHKPLALQQITAVVTKALSSRSAGRSRRMSRDI